MNMVIVENWYFVFAWEDCTEGREEEEEIDEEGVGTAKGDGFDGDGDGDGGEDMEVPILLVLPPVDGDKEDGEETTNCNNAVDTFLIKDEFLRRDNCCWGIVCRKDKAWGIFLFSRADIVLFKLVLKSVHLLA